MSVAADDAVQTGDEARIARAFWRLTGGFWRRPGATRARLLTLALAGAIAGVVIVNVAMNRWQGWFITALERKDHPTVWNAVVVLPLLAFCIAGIGVLVVLTRETLQVRWREWCTAALLERWLADKRFWRITLGDREPANPEYRIADDIRMATEPVVDFAIGLLQAVLGAAAFFGILWSIGGSISVGGVTIPAYMVVAALVYGMISSTLVFFVGRPLLGKVAQRNAAEARFRFALMRLRENAEQVALLGGEADERRRADGIYAGVVRRWLIVIRQHCHLTWVTNGNGALLAIVPLLLAAPKYLAGEISFGQVTQLAGAFVQVQAAISWLVDNFRQVAQWGASARRVVELAEALEAMPDEARVGGIALTQAPSGAGLAFVGLAIADSAGRPLLGPMDLTVAPGERVLVAGESGLGKSLVARVVAGQWRAGSGRVERAAGARLVLLAQRPYFPVGTLREALLYPARAEPVDDAVLAAALDLVGLGPLSGRLAETERWDQVLASGERQRLALARLVIERPDIAVLDDALSAIDPAGQEAVLAALARALPGLAILHLAQSERLAAAHDRAFRLARREGGARLEVVG